MHGQGWFAAHGFAVDQMWTGFVELREISHVTRMTSDIGRFGLFMWRDFSRPFRFSSKLVRRMTTMKTTRDRRGRTAAAATRRRQENNQTDQSHAQQQTNDPIDEISIEE